ncbi:MAG: sulfatase-like hydrolase/transferase [Comamonadaceae bacterium]|nr:sulfatase-like hydrolase/transferase [Comamonadaceae bacterium]
MVAHAARPRLGPTVLLVVCFAACMGLRWQLTVAQLAQATACTRDCLVWSAPAYDAGVLGVLLALVGLAKASPAWLRWPLTLCALAVLWLYAIDMAVYDLFSFRLRMADLAKYAGDFSSNTTVALPYLASGRGLLLAALTLLTSVFLVLASRRAWTTPRQKTRALVYLCALPILWACRYLPQDAEYIHQNGYQDYLSSNLQSGTDTPFSAALRARLQNAPAPAQTCTPSAKKARPVILLVVESLSLHHSQKFAGLKNYTPALDRIASQYSYLESFYANGFTTDGGLIALLTGHVPFPQVNRYQSTNTFAGYDKPQQDFFAALARHHVPALYFTSADLNFLGTRGWLKNLGFTSIEGPEHPAYAGLPRGSFDDPGDAALYRRLLQWLDQERPAGPFFAVVQTITTHPPFTIPGSAQHGEEAALRYADAALGELVAQLQARHFFDDGLLFITGDHRSMTLLDAQEKARLGPAAPARVPAVVVSAEHRGQPPVAGQWQQADAIPSFLATMGLPSCTSDFQGRFLEQPVQARFIFHPLGAQRGQVLVKIKDQETPFLVRLAGDDTAWINAPADAQDARAALQEINRQRALLPDLEANFAHELLRFHQWIP